MADTAGHEANEHLARARLGQLDLLHDERRAELLQDGGADLHPTAILRRPCFLTDGLRPGSAGTAPARAARTTRDRRSGGICAARREAVWRAQVESRQCDFAARYLQQTGRSFSHDQLRGTREQCLCSAGAPPDRSGAPALPLGRRSTCGACRSRCRASTRARDVLLGVAGMRRTEPMAGGRHKVFGRAELAIIPQTSTIASHLPRAVGVAFAIESGPRWLGAESPWPDRRESSCCKASATRRLNHATAQVGADQRGASLRPSAPAAAAAASSARTTGFGISVRTAAAAGSPPALRAPPAAALRVAPTAPTPDDASTRVAARARRRGSAAHQSPGVSCTCARCGSSATPDPMLESAYRSAAGELRRRSGSPTRWSAQPGGSSRAASAYGWRRRWRAVRGDPRPDPSARPRGVGRDAAGERRRGHGSARFPARPPRDRQAARSAHRTLAACAVRRRPRPRAKAR